MKTIYKYELIFGDNNLFYVPPGYEVLQAAYQEHRLFVWIYHSMLRDSKTDVPVIIEVFGTGWEMQKLPRKYINTVFDSMGLVWHVFEKL